MRSRWIGLLLAVFAPLSLFTNTAQAQLGSGLDEPGSMGPGHDGYTPATPWRPDKPENGGMYVGAEFLFMRTQRALGRQLIAVTGFVDSDGSISGTPGTRFGSGLKALDLDDFGRVTWQPGFRLTAGFVLSDQTNVSISYYHLTDATYNTAATPVRPGFQTQGDLSDTFLYAPVFNFHPFFAGPPNKVIAPGATPNAVFGIWNGATTMDLSYTQHFSGTDITVSRPVLQNTEYNAMTYALAGGRFAWIWERLNWRTVSFDANGGGGSPQDSALYTNIQSQRMYGPFLGARADAYLGEGFSFATEVTAAALFSLSKQYARYRLDSLAIQSKWSRRDYTIVPNVNAKFDLYWRPMAGVELRAGYEAMAFFNTTYMEKPVAFNAGAPDASYKRKFLRVYHGLNIGLSFNF